MGEANKTNTIEISNKSITLGSNQNTQNISPTNNLNIKNETIENFISIDSPMVGIIYLTPKPSSPPFAKKGQKIKKGDTICLIEAMKTVCDEDSVDHVLFFVVDILREESTLFVPNENIKKVAEKSFGVNVLDDTVVLPGVVSRKKQIIPNLKL